MDFLQAKTLKSWSIGSGNIDVIQAKKEEIKYSAVEAYEKKVRKVREINREKMYGEKRYDRYEGVRDNM